MIGDWTVEENNLAYKPTDEDWARVGGYDAAKLPPPVLQWEHRVEVDGRGLTMSILTGAGTYSNKAKDTVEVAFVRKGRYHNPRDFKHRTDGAGEIYPFVQRESVIA